MLVVSKEQYEIDKLVFFTKHNSDFKEHTHTSNKCSLYSKEYAFFDGACWYEHANTVTEKVEAEVCLVKMEVEVKMLRIEYYSTDDSTSRYFFEMV